MCCCTGRDGAGKVAELVWVVVVVGECECVYVEGDGCAVCGVVVGPFEGPGVWWVCHAKTEVVGRGVVSDEGLFGRDGIGKGKGVDRGRGEVGEGRGGRLGLDGGRRGGGKEERFGVWDGEAVSVEVKGHLERGEGESGDMLDLDTANLWCSFACCDNRLPHTVLNSVTIQKST